MESAGDKRLSIAISRKNLVVRQLRFLSSIVITSLGGEGAGRSAGPLIFVSTLCGFTFYYSGSKLSSKT